MRQPIHIVTAGDVGVTWGIAAALGSLLNAVPAGIPFRATLIDGGLPEEVRSRLLQSYSRRPGAELNFVPFRWPEGCDAPALEGSRLTYARLFIPEFVHEECCLYIDADTVVRRDPCELFELAKVTPDAPVIAARNYPVSGYHAQLGRQSAQLVDGVRPDAPYFNAGVLMINLELWRQRDVARRCLELASKHQFISHDQDALNVFFHNQWSELPDRWNYQLYERTEFPATAALLHYSGRNKPWASGYPPVAREPFLNALAAAGFPDWRPEISLTTLLRNSPLRPVLSKAQYWARRSIGLSGVARR